MNLNDLNNAATEIKAKYMSLGGKTEMFAEFWATLQQSIEFGLNADYVTEPVDLVGQWFSPRYAGIKEKFDLREVVGKRENPDGEKNYSFLDKKYI